MPNKIEDKPFSKILLVDDEPDIIEIIQYHLEKEGYLVKTATNGIECLSIAKSFIPDLILLDVMMPEMDGIEACVELRKDNVLKGTLIAFLTARSEDYSQVAGFEAGADDYITKPFSQKLLIERIRAVLRRSSLKNSSEPNKMIQRNELSLDPDRHLCLWKGMEVRLTVTEFLILHSLVFRPGLVKNRDQLIDIAYGETIYVDDRTIDSHIKRMRRKFRLFDKDFDRIETLYGVGYRYRDG